MTDRFSSLLLPSVLLACFMVFMVAGCSKTTAPDHDLTQQLVADMTLEKKIGQLFMVHIPDATYGDETRTLVEDYAVGGVILYSISGNVQSPEQVATLTRDMQLGARSATGVPLFISVDQEGGRVNRLRQGFAEFPAAMAVAATQYPQYATLAAVQTARQLRAVGINVNFAPVMDVNNNPHNPIIASRSYGADPQTVSRYGAAAIRGYYQTGVLACAKHFPGHGDTDIDSHKDLPVVNASMDRLEDVELRPFEAAIKAGVPMIMTAHVYVPALEGESGIPATLSRKVLTDLLRDDLDFEGLIVTDSMHMGAIRKRYGAGQAAVRAFEAGADILLIGADLFVSGENDESLRIQRETMQYFLEQAKAGKIAMERIDQSVARILDAKRKAGLLTMPLPDPAKAAELCGTQEQEELAGEIAHSGLSVVRNSNNLLPVSKDEKIAVLVPEKYLSLAQKIYSRNPEATLLPITEGASEKEISFMTILAGKEAKIFVLISGLKKHPEQFEMLESLLDVDESRVGVVALGSPYELLRIPDVQCAVAAYAADDAMSGAIADMFAGEFMPKGVAPANLK